jgi:hypothetical protein
VQVGVPPSPSPSLSRHSLPTFSMDTPSTSSTPSSSLLEASYIPLISPDLNQLDEWKHMSWLDKMQQRAVRRKSCFSLLSHEASSYLSSSESNAQQLERYRPSNTAPVSSSVALTPTTKSRFGRNSQLSTVA